MNLVPFVCESPTNEQLLKPYLIYIRQYFPYTLTERVASKPYLTLTDKKWIVFQLLHAYYQLVEVSEYHGDINFDNILLTTNMSVYLADYAKYKPHYFNCDDFTTINNWYSNEYNENKPIYFAPEKIIDKQTTITPEPSDLVKMDIFSIGVVIGQLFLENTMFTRVNLLNYKNKGQDGDEEFKNKINKINDNYNEGKDTENTCLIDLLKKMLEIDPTKRPSINECLQDYCNYICPMPIPRCILHMNCYFNLKYPQGDIIVATLHKYWTQIYSLCYLNYNEWNSDKQKVIPVLKGNLHYKILNVVNTDSIFEMTISDFPFIINENGGLNYPNEINFSNITGSEKRLSLNDECMQTAKESVYIFLKFIFYALQNIKYESTIIIALEMIYHLSKELSSNVKVEFVIPHIVALFSSSSGTIIKIYALNCLFELLQTITFKDLKLQLIDSTYFRSYIFIKIIDNFHSNCLLRKYFLSYLDKIVLFQMKFLQCFIYNQVGDVKDKKSITDHNTKSNNNNEGNDNNKKATNDDAKRKLKEKEIITLYHKETDDDTEECFYAQLKHAIINLYIIDNESGKYDKDALIEFIKVLPKTVMVFTPSKQNELQQIVFEIIHECYNYNSSFVSVITEVIKIIPQLAFIESNSYAEKFLNDGLKSENEIHNVQAIRSARQFVFELNRFSIVDYIPIFINVIQLIKHPNYQIRKETKMFFKEIIGRYEGEELSTVQKNITYCVKEMFSKLPIKKFNFNDESFIEKLFNSKLFCPRAYYDLFDLFKSSALIIPNQKELKYSIVLPPKHQSNTLNPEEANDDKYKQIPFQHDNEKFNLGNKHIMLTLPLKDRQKEFMFIRTYIFNNYIKGLFYEHSYVVKEIDAVLNLNEKLSTNVIKDIYYLNRNMIKSDGNNITEDMIRYLNAYHFDQTTLKNILSLSQIEKKTKNKQMKGYYLISFCSIQDVQLFNYFDEQFNLKAYPPCVDFEDETNKLPYCLIKFVISIIYPSTQHYDNYYYIMKVKLLPFYRIQDLIYEQIMKYIRIKSNYTINPKTQSYVVEGKAYFQKLFKALNQDKKISLNSFLFPHPDDDHSDTLNLLKLKYYLYSLNIKPGYQIHNTGSESTIFLTSYMSTIQQYSYQSNKYNRTNIYLDRYNSQTLTNQEPSWDKAQVIYSLDIEDNSDSIVKLLKIPSYTTSNLVSNNSNNYNIFISVTQKGKIYIHYINDNLYTTSIIKEQNKIINSLSNRNYQITELKRNNITLLSPKDSKHVCNDLVIAANESIIHLLDLTNGNVTICKNTNETNEKYITCISPQINNEYDLLLLANHDCSLSLLDINSKSIVQTCNYYNYNHGYITSILHQDNTNALLTTSLGKVLEYDYRLNMIVNSYSFLNSDGKIISYPIDGILPFEPPRYLYNKNEQYFNQNHKYCFVYTNEPEFDMCLWDTNTWESKLFFTNKTQSSISLSKKENECLFNKKYSYYGPSLYFTDLVNDQIKMNQLVIPSYMDDMIKTIQHKVNCVCLPYLTNCKCNLPCLITGGNDGIKCWNFEKESNKIIQSKTIMTNEYEVNDMIMLDNLLNNKKLLVSAHENGSLNLISNS